MADGKWIEGLRAELSPDEAARLAFIARLAVVREYLPRVLNESADAENVHQLRVGTRRADAALRNFHACLPDADYKKARKQLRKLRHAAGAARDWDVFALEVTERRRGRPEKEHPGLDHLHGYALGQRASAQVELEAVVEKASRQFGMFVTDTIDAVHLPDDPAHSTTLIEMARPTLFTLRDELHHAAEADLTNYELLHKVRIAGKRLRYAMELFADCFGPEFKEQLYPLVEDMQEILGLANDSHVAVSRLTSLRAVLKAAWPGAWSVLRSGIEGLLRFHQRRLPQEQRRFLAWWNEWQRTGESLLDSCIV